MIVKCNLQSHGIVFAFNLHISQDGYAFPCLFTYPVGCLVAVCLRETAAHYKAWELVLTH